jgi:Clustered mitochondria
MCTVDYHGYRVLAVAKLPLAKQVFTAEGKLRKTTTELVHGTVDRGATVAAEDRGIMAALQVCHMMHNSSVHCSVMYLVRHTKAHCAHVQPAANSHAVSVATECTFSFNCILATAPCVPIVLIVTAYCDSCSIIVLTLLQYLQLLLPTYTTATATTGSSRQIKPGASRCTWYN